jgi:CO/xanthine dehydrogenase Mo-binding subunit
MMTLTFQGVAARAGRRLEKWQARRRARNSTGRDWGRDVGLAAAWAADSSGYAWWDGRLTSGSHIFTG